MLGLAQSAAAAGLMLAGGAVALRRLGYLLPLSFARGAAAAFQPSFLVVDFDGTCTVRDTIGLLPLLADAHAGTGRRKLAAFECFEAAYLDGLQRVTERHVDGSPCGDPDLDGLSECLRAMDSFSTEISAQVSESGCLSGIRLDEVSSTMEAWAADPARRAALPELQAGAAAALHAAAARGSRIGVLSINWCPELVRATLTATCPALDELWCNSIDSDGRIAVRFAGAEEKRLQIASLREERVVVYVGDSATDLPALLEADVGILVGQSRSARRIAARFGVRVAPLPHCDVGASSAVEAEEMEEAEEADEAQQGSGEVRRHQRLGLLWEAAGWDEIGGYLELLERRRRTAVVS